MDLREIVWKDEDWVHLARDRDQWPALVKTEMSLWAPWGAGDFLIG